MNYFKYPLSQPKLTFYLNNSSLFYYHIEMAELTTPTKPKAEDSKKMETPSKKQKRNSIV